MKIAIVVLNILAAAGGFAASAFWFKASKTALPPVDEATGRPAGPVSMDAVYKELVAAANLNRTAASWSCAAAFFAGVSLLLSSI